MHFENRGTRRRSGLLGLASLVSLVGLLGFASSARAQALQPGEILLSDLTSNDIQRYSASGTLEQTYTSTNTGNFWGEASITPDGNIVTTFLTPNRGIAILSPGGSLINSFFTPVITVLPGDVSVFADGTLAISDQSAGAIQLYSQGGTFLKSLAVPGSDDLFGSTIGSDNTLWVTDIRADSLFHLTESGTLLNDFSLGFSPSDVVVDPTDGSLWVADFDGNNIVHLDQTTGNTIGSFSNGFSSSSGHFEGIGISPDGGTLYATDNLSNVINEFDTSGLTTGSISIGNTGSHVYLTVVPNSASINASAPEPGSLALAGVGCSVLGVGGMGIRRRRRVAG